MEYTDATPAGPGGRYYRVTIPDGATPTITARGHSPAGFRVTVTGPAGGPVRLEVSTDLTGWSPLVTLDNPDGTVEYTDAIPAGPNGRYYRARTGL